MGEAVTIFQFSVYLHLIKKKKQQDVLCVESPFFVENYSASWEDEIFVNEN